MKTYGFAVVETPDGPMLQVPLKQHCELPEEDHGWDVAVEIADVGPNASPLVTIRAQPMFAGVVQIPLDVMRDQGLQASAIAADLIAKMVVYELLDEAVPCHGPEVEMKVAAAVKAALEKRDAGKTTERVA